MKTKSMRCSINIQGCWLIKRPKQATSSTIISSTSRNRSAVPDDIPTEPPKVDANIFVTMVYPLFVKIWPKNEVSAEWKKGYLINFPKKESQYVFKQQRNNTALYPW